MPITLNGTTGITSPEVTLDNGSADGGQVVLKSSGFSNWNIDNFSGDLRSYYGSTVYTTVTSSGNVGIGTSSPVAKLDIAGSDPGVQMAIRNWPMLSVGSPTALEFGGVNSSQWQTIKYFTAGSERMRLNSTGNLLIGTTSGRGQRVEIVASAGVGTLALQVSANGNGGIDWYNASGGYVASTIVNSSSVSYNTTSDYRLKENIAPMTGALAKVAQLNPVTWSWKNTGEQAEGFIAHELAEVCPNAVSGEKDAVDANGNPKYQGVDTSFLVATLTAAIQELKAELDTVKSELATLKGA